jgi:hypothetical protein
MITGRAESINLGRAANTLTFRPLLARNDKLSGFQLAQLLPYCLIGNVQAFGDGGIGGFALLFDEGQNLLLYI